MPSGLFCARARPGPIWSESSNAVIQANGRGWHGRNRWDSILKGIVVAGQFFGNDITVMKQTSTAIFLFKNNKDYRILERFKVLSLKFKVGDGSFARSGRSEAKWDRFQQSSGPSCAGK